jgi:5'-nucleotidase/UDP-sugar diphosphatase
MNTRVIALCGAALALLAAGPVSASEKEAASKDTVQVQTALSATGVASKETNLGDLIADALKQTGRADVSLIPADEINSHAQIPAGKTDPSAIVQTLRYADDPSDTVVVLDLTGAQLLKVAARSVSRAPEPFDGFLQVSGLQIRYSPDQPEGKRVSRVTVGDSAIDTNKTYRVATTRPPAGGSLGYFQIWSKKDIAEDTGVSLSKSLSNYLSAHKTISSAVENRITTH